MTRPRVVNARREPYRVGRTPLYGVIPFERKNYRPAGTPSSRLRRAARVRLPTRVAVTWLLHAAACVRETTSLRRETNH